MSDVRSTPLSEPCPDRLTLSGTAPLFRAIYLLEAKHELPPPVEVNLLLDPNETCYYTIPTTWHQSRVQSRGYSGTSEARLSAIKRGFHALDLFTNTSGAESPLQPESIEWASLDRLIKIRNRITHPKCTDDLLLSDDDLSAVERGADVVLYLFFESLDRNSRVVTKRLRDFEPNHLPAEEFACADHRQITWPTNPL